MEHHVGDASDQPHWSRVCNDLIHRVCTLYPENFVGVCQLPQSPGVPPQNCIAELERCVEGARLRRLQPEPGSVRRLLEEPPLTDRWWYPLYEKMVELDVPAMVHVSASCNPAFHATGAHYINADTTAFMQLIQARSVQGLPDAASFIIPHGGGAVPYHWGRYRGLAQDMKRPPLDGAPAEERLLRHLRLPSAGHRPADQGHSGRQHPVRLRDGRRGARHRPGDRALLRRHQALHRGRAQNSSDGDRKKIFEGNARRVYSRWR